MGIIHEFCKVGLRSRIPRFAWVNKCPGDKWGNSNIPNLVAQPQLMWYNAFPKIDPCSGAPGMGCGLSPAPHQTCWLAPHGETYWVKNQEVNYAKFSNFIVAVKLCKQCLQTTSASGRSSPPDPLPELRPRAHWGTSVPQTPRYAPPNENPRPRH